MSERSAHRWREGELPSDRKKPRHWRTHPDPFAGIWAEAIEPLLASDRKGVLQAPAVLQWLQDKYPDRFADTQLRTLQRRIRDWRALNGPDKEVYFPQVHPPGREAQVDFSSGNDLGITIAGQPFPHLLFEFVLSFSGWRYVQIASAETFLALKSCLQAALWQLGGCPRVIRSHTFFKELYPPGRHGHARCLFRRGQSQVSRSGAAISLQRFRVPLSDLRPDRSGRDCKAPWRVRAFEQPV